MKVLRSLTILLFAFLFLNACSQYRPAQAPQRSAPQQAKQESVIPNVSQRRGYSQRQRRISQQSQSSAVIPHHPVRGRLVNIAMSTLGRPYKWGGDNPQQGFDCSGLMRYVHKNAVGINIPRTAAAQQNASRTVSYQNLQPGDMLFFKIGKRTNHVGVYIGDRKFVHAPSSGKRVTVATMDSAYWHKRFVKFGTFL